MSGRSVFVLSGALIASLSGCFASQNDIRVLQNDLVVMRQEALQANNDRQKQMDRLVTMINSLSGSVHGTQDSIRAISARLRDYAANQRHDYTEVLSEMARLGEIVGQSQTQVQAIRTEMERRKREVVTPAVVVPDSASVPGELQLLEMGRSNLRSGSYATARQVFGDLIQQYPNSASAPEAQLQIGIAFEGEKDTAKADSVYALVIQQYPTNKVEVPKALYKRGNFAMVQGKKKEARAFFKQIIDKYPTADEASIARMRLDELKG
jgi:tol-pal system protein YbgF